MIEAIEGPDVFFVVDGIGEPVGRIADEVAFGAGAGEDELAVGSGVGFGQNELLYLGRRAGNELGCFFPCTPVDVSYPSEAFMNYLTRVPTHHHPENEAAACEGCRLAKLAKREQP